MYWIECLRCIRKFYSNPVLIIDDNSNYNFISQNISLNNVEIIQSEFHQRGELLPYYYFHKLKPFDHAIILHDSVFIQKYINFISFKHVIFLWSFTHDWDNPEEEKTIIKTMKNSNDLMEVYDNKSRWLGCFGCMAIISHEFLDRINEKYEIFDLLNYIKTRRDRMCLERVFACICYSMNDKLPSLFGDIHKYFPIGYTFEDYKRISKLQYCSKDIIKVWSGR